MKKIFGILVVLMMVAGTFVSCSMPTNDSTGAGTSVSDSIIAEGTDGALKLVKDRDGYFHLCTKDFSGNTTESDTVIACGGLKSYLPVQDDLLYVSNEEYRTPGANATFSNGVLVITCSTLHHAASKLEYNEYTLQYQIN